MLFSCQKCFIAPFFPFNCCLSVVLKSFLFQILCINSVVGSRVWAFKRSESTLQFTCGGSVTPMHLTYGLTCCLSFEWLGFRYVGHDQCKMQMYTLLEQTL